jgi:hypothetical protein
LAPLLGIIAAQRDDSPGDGREKLGGSERVCNRQDLDMPARGWDQQAIAEADGMLGSGPGTTCECEGLQPAPNLGALFVREGSTWNAPGPLGEARVKRIGERRGAGRSALDEDDPRAEAPALVEHDRVCS